MIVNGTIARNSTSTPPESIGSWHCVSRGYKGSTLDMIQEPFGAKAGHFDIPVTGAFLHQSSVPREIMMEYGHDTTPGFSHRYGPVDFVRNSSVVFAYTDRVKNGPAFTLDDVRDFDGWKGATEFSKAVSYGDVPSTNDGLIRLPETRIEYTQFGMTNVAKHVSPVIAFGDMNINDYGKELSILRNEEQRFRNFLFYNDFTHGPSFDPETGYHPFNPDSLEFVGRLVDKGIDEDRDLGGFGTGDLSHRQANAAAYFKKFLVVDKNLHSRILKEADILGYSWEKRQEYIEKRYNSIMRHEKYHFHEPADEDIPTWLSESRIGDIESEYDAEKASLNGNDVDAVLARIYANYAERFRYGGEGTNGSNSTKRSTSRSRLENMVKHAKSAGMTDVETEEAIENMLEEMVNDELDGDTSFDEVEYANEVSDYDDREVGYTDSEGGEADFDDEAEAV